MAWSTVELLRVLAASQLLLFAVLLARDFRQDRSAMASLALCLTAACSLIQPLLAARSSPALVLHLTVLVGLAMPAAFWILARVHFDDDCCLRLRHWVFFAGVEAAGYVAWLSAHKPGVTVGREFASWEWGLQALPLVIIAHALVNVYVGSRADLVVARLRRRYWILGVTGTFVLLERTTMALAHGTSRQATVEAAYAVSVVLVVFAVLVASTLVQPSILKPTPPSASTEPPADPRLVEQLRRLVEVEHVYREEGLSIVALAGRLGAHEYKVRQLVNSQLGFKNFNAFLHHYRLAEAQRLLADPARRHLTVAQVAFEVGYRSLGPFNRAFKEATGSTPTEFRAARQGELEGGQTPSAALGPERPATS